MRQIMRKLTFLLLSFCFSLGIAMAQNNRTVSGTVKDDKGNPLTGASVTIKGTQLGTITDGMGVFSIKGVPASAKTVVVTFLNYETQEISIANQNTVQVRLAASTSEIEEVVVTGLSKTKKSQYAGSTTKVMEKDIRNVPVGSFEQVLQGRVPGLTVLNGSGQPGNAASVTLRGPSSIQGTSVPLYVVDGVPVEASVFQSINPNDFESIDVLKDGISQALYGNRGAAGVIVVTTKRGASGKARFSYSNQMGMRGRPQFNYRMMNAAELLAAQEKLGLILPGSAASLPGWINSRRNPANAALSPAQLSQLDRNLDSLSNINTDWDDLYFRNGKFQNHEISLSGSVGKARIYSNIAYYTEEGIIQRSDMRRVTMRNNFDYGDDKLTFRVTSLLGYTRRNFQESDAAANLNNPFLVTRITPGYLSLYKADGTFNTANAQPYFGINLYQAMQLNQNYNDQLKITLGSEAAYKISNNLTAGIQNSIDFRETNNTFYGDQRTFINQISTSILTRAGTYQEGIGRTAQISVRPYVSYKKIIKNDHDFEVSVYGEYLRTFNKSFTTTARGTDPKRPNTPAATLAGTVTNQLIPTFGGAKSQRTNISAFSVARYTYKNKYTLNATVRRDGTSVLPEKNRWKTFAAFGGVWEMSKENFMRNVKNINYLRLKASWGQSANLENFPLGYFGYFVH
ncbi:MAG: SusC/RagA family TonB-linked outer membrane protein [Chitinophagaceae bacterium]|nr:SusC/RagA family TonB-linked outer membrane protein [Chitinophagaceae bacterium]